MGFANVTWEVVEGVGTLTINRPKQLNALDAATLGEIGTAVELCKSRPEEVLALVITGAGEKAFVAGADIAAMSRLGPAEAREFAALGHRTMSSLEALPIVTIAAVNGFALGGGCELMLACDLCYASEKARFGQPEVNLGLVPGFGGTQRLTRRVGPMRAKELILSGDMVDAAQARAQARARLIASRGPQAVALSKRLVQHGADLPLQQALDFERNAFAGLFGGAEAREGMAAFLEKRPARFPGR
jgi:enoyl-CoA hydratase